MNDLDLQKLFNYLICLNFWIPSPLCASGQSSSSSTPLVFGQVGHERRVSVILIRDLKNSI